MRVHQFLETSVEIGRKAKRPDLRVIARFKVGLYNLLWPPMINLIPRNFIPSCFGTVQKTIALILGDSVNPYLDDQHFQVV
jgi:hypothetical protein